MVKFVSLLPHMISVIQQDNGVLLIEPSGIVARCQQHGETVDSINGIAITKQVFGDVENLPEPQENVMYIVSRLVAEACPNRHDLLITGPAIRNPDGVIIGCNGLSRLY